MRRRDAERYRRHLDTVTEALTDEAALEVVDLFRPWASGTAYSVGDRISYGELLYSCVQAHTAQDDWTPDVTPALWTRVSVDEWPEWVQPVGASDAYELGAKVSHNDKHWVSTIDANVYEPGVYGWEEAE